MKWLCEPPYFIRVIFKYDLILVKNPNSLMIPIIHKKYTFLQIITK